jgi:hypothetical protein
MDLRTNATEPPKRLSRNMNDKSFQIPSAASDYRKYSFFPRTIRDWNARPPGVITAPSVEAFKQSLTDKAELNSYIFWGRGVRSVCAPKSWHYNQLDDCGHYQAETETERVLWVIAITWHLSSVVNILIFCCEVHNLGGMMCVRFSTFRSSFNLFGQTKKPLSSKIVLPIGTKLYEMMNERSSQKIVPIDQPTWLSEEIQIQLCWIQI